MTYRASRGNIIIIIIASYVLFRIFSGIFGISLLGPRNIKPIQEPVRHEKENKIYRIPQAKKMQDLYTAGKRGDTTAKIASFMILAGIIILVLASIFFIVEAFGVSSVWGVCVFLFNGIAIILFLIFHWNRGKIPLLVYLVGILMLISGNALA